MQTQNNARNNARMGVITNWDAMEKQIHFYREHLDIFIEDAFKPIKLTRAQHVLMRQMGNCIDSNDTCSRGFGKTWLASLAGFSICVLYPGTTVLIVSATAKQATLALGKLKLLAEQNPNIANEILASNSKSLVSVNKDSSSCTLKNGSKLISASIDSARGIRAKVIIVDEALDVDQDTLEAVVSPIRNTTREICFNYGFKDYPSKTITITSACEKSNQYYDAFMKNVIRMSKGDRTAFACALDYRAAAANGITDMDFFIKEKERMPDLTFQMEYGSKFVGANSNSALPFTLTTPCRTLEKIEMEQPKNSKSRYVICTDIATSTAKGSDNSIIIVIKFTERADGTFTRKVVFIKSYNGKPLDFLANEIRKLYHLRFPNTEKIVYDARGVGDSLDRFFDQEWVDPVTGKEYPPLVVDDEPLTNPDAQQTLHPFRAVNTLNQRIYTNLRVVLEKHMIELPASERFIRSQQLEIEDESKRMSPQEMAVFLEADALQFEMGNIVEKTSASGNKTYDVPRANQHKDRYSALAMANDYISEIEKENVRLHKRGPVCVGITGGFDDGFSRKISNQFRHYKF